MVTVRSATPADAAELASLRYEFRAAERPPTEPREEFIARCAAWIEKRLAAAAPWSCFVAERGGAVVGHVWIELVEKIPNPGDEAERHAYLTNLYIQPAARGGAGSALLEVALEWCRAQEVDTVILWPSERSRALYARYGFATSGAVMTLPLGRH